MLSAPRSYTTHHSTNPHSITAAAARVLLFLSLSAFAICLLAVRPKSVHASGGSLSLGTVNVSQQLPACPGSGWIKVTDSNGKVHTIQCYLGAVENCNSVDNIGITFGSLSPTGISRARPRALSSTSMEGTES